MADTSDGVVSARAGRRLSCARRSGDGHGSIRSGAAVGAGLNRSTCTTLALPLPSSAAPPACGGVTYTVVHMFSGSGGCSRGFQLEDFKTIAAIDFDADACADLDYLLGEQVAVHADIAKMTTADLRQVAGHSAPDVVVLTPPCKAWSRCLPKQKRYSPKYQAMTRLAPRAVHLALGAWETPPKLIVIENVRGMNTEGRELMQEIQKDLRRHGYVWNIRTWNLGEFGLAQNRDRCLFVARHEPQVPCFLMVPPRSRPRPCGEDLGQLPPPIMSKSSDSMHKLPQLSALNWLRLAAIPAGKDWKALPARIRLGGQGRARHDGKFGVEDPAKPAHTVTAKNRVVSGWSAVADQRAFEFGAVPATDGGQSHLIETAYELGPHAHSGILGVEDPAAPAHTVTGNARVQGSWGAVADLRVDDHDGQRKNGGFGVNAWTAPAHTILAEGSVQNTWSSISSPLRSGAVARAWSGRRGDRGRIDPRLTCEQWSGAYGVLDPAEPSPTVLAHTRHDNAPGSYADPGLDHAPRNGSYGVLDPDEPSPTIRGHHEVRQAPGAVADARLEVDPRKDWAHDTHGGRPHNYGVQPWDAPASTIKGKQVVQNSRAAVAHPDYPTPTHRLVRDADGELVLLGPPIRDWNEVCYLVIQAEDGSWHRPLTDLELAVLQSLPAYHRGEMLALRGPSGKRREHIGNMLPTLAAQAIARECRATLDAAGDGFRLVGGGDVWVRQPAQEGARA